MKKFKLLILKGIPGSGKSTFARNFIKNNSEKWVIINRDLIRSMLGNYWVPKREKLITDIEYYSTIKAFKRGYNVIIDATNLNPKTLDMWERCIIFAKKEKINVTLEIRNFNISIKKAIFRDWKRGLFGGKKIGAKVIRNFYKKYYG